jgi:hypothetical protein
MPSLPQSVSYIGKDIFCVASPQLAIIEGVKPALRLPRRCRFTLLDIRGRQ